MKRRNFIKTAMIGASVSLAPNLLFGKTNDDLPNVLIIGDSISIGYTKFVQEMMKGKANVYRPLNAKGGFLNCQGTTSGIKKIDEWLSVKKWDIIHFNFGLHDLKHVDAKTGKNSMKPEDPQQADVKAYKKNLTEIVKKLEATGAKLIFATTTPFPDKPGGPLRRANQPAKYNKGALKIMKKNNIKINDLHAFTLPRLKELQLPNNVHFTKEGSEILAKQVVEKILEII
jgi:lysophospholipase L1-like esterase